MWCAKSHFVGCQWVWLKLVEDIRDYSCLQDTQQYNHTWLTANPYIEIEGIQSVGNYTNLICNSVPGAPLYWILPGDQQVNDDIKIIDTSSEVNSSTTAIVRLDDLNYNSEFKCCLRIKHGQFPTACSTFKFDYQDLDAHLVSTSADFMYSNSMLMSCAFQSGFYTPDRNLIKWQECRSSSYCNYIPHGYYSSEADDTAKTLNATLKNGYDSDIRFYKCLYHGRLLHTFEVKLGSKSPLVHETSKEIYYSTDGYAVKLSCLASSNPQPTFTWTQSKMLEFSNGSEIITSGGNYDIETSQISITVWQTTLVIYPYDVTIHNNVYTCTANNSVGQHSAQLNTNKGPAEMDVILIYNLKWTDTTNAIRAICTFKIFPYLPNYHINVVTAESIHFNTTVSYDDRLETVMVTVNFEANVRLFPVTVECTTFNPFDSKSQKNDKIYIDSNTPTSIS